MPTPTTIRVGCDCCDRDRFYRRPNPGSAHGWFFPSELEACHQAASSFFFSCFPETPGLAESGPGPHEQEIPECITNNL